MIEVIAVLLVIGIVAGIVIRPNGRPNAELISDVTRLKNVLRYVQIRAQSDTYEWRLAFTDNNTYQIGPRVITGRGFTPSLIPAEVGTEADLSSGVFTDGVTTGDDTAIRFDLWGRPSNELGELITTDQVITLTAGDQSEQIIIEAGTGFIR